jgi:hypothetical protein
MLSKVDECQGVKFFPHGGIPDISLLCTLHVRCHFARLVIFCCHMPTKLKNYWWKGSVSTAIPPPSATNLMGKENKTGGIPFRVSIIYINHILYQPIKLLGALN